MKKILIAGAATAALGATALVATPAHADVERRGTCAGASYELSVDRERGGYDVDADLENARAYSTWQVAIRHNGKVAVSRTLNADDEGELDLDTRTRDTRGKDVYQLTVKPSGGSACSTSVTV